MKKYVNFPNKSIIKLHFKLNWKIVLFFTVFWTLITLFIFIAFDIGNQKMFIAKAISMNDNESFCDLNTPIVEIIYGVIGTIFLSIVSLVIVCLNFNSDFWTGNINFWMTSPFSRKQIFLSKLFFSFFEITLVFLPSFLITTIISSLANDAKEYIGFVIYYGLNHLLYWYLIISILVLITLLTIEISYLSIIICSLFIVWISFISFTTMVYYEDTSQSVYGILRYLSPQILIAYVLNFQLENPMLLKKAVNDYNFQFGKYIYQDLWFEILSPIIIITLNILITFLTSWIFNKKDLRI